jgi:CRP-like cAMP-binding protein
VPQSGVAARVTAKAVGVGRGGDGGDRMGREWAALLGEVPLFAGLPKRQLRRIAGLGRTRRFEAGALLIRAGDPGDAFYVVLDGQARVRPGSGRAAKLGAGDFFGEMALLDGAPRSADVEAVGEVLTMRIGRASFTKLLRREPQIAAGVMAALATRIRSLERGPRASV